jgi:hypothetical protein
VSTSAYLLCSEDAFRLANEKVANGPAYSSLSASAPRLSQWQLSISASTPQANSTMVNKRIRIMWQQGSFYAHVPVDSRQVSTRIVAHWEFPLSTPIYAWPSQPHGATAGAAGMFASLNRTRVQDVNVHLKKVAHSSTTQPSLAIKRRVDVRIALHTTATPLRACCSGHPFVNPFSDCHRYL